MLVQHKLADHLYPLKSSDVVKKIVEETGVAFIQHNHTQARQKFEARPRNGAAQPQNTSRDFCIYHAAHGDYTFSDQWVQKLVDACDDAQQFKDLKAFKL